MNPNIKCTCPFGNPQIGIDDNCPIHGLGEHETITTAGDQPLSPQSSVGVKPEDVLCKYNQHPNKEYKNLYLKSDVLAAMTEYSSLMNKEKDREIEGLNNVISKLFADKVSETRELQQLLSEKEKEIESLNEIISQKMELLVKANERIEELEKQLNGA